MVFEPESWCLTGIESDRTEKPNNPTTLKSIPEATNNYVKEGEILKFVYGYSEC